MKMKTTNDDFLPHILSKQEKVLLIQILKAGEITKDQSDVLCDLFQNLGWWKQINLVFTDFNNEDD